MPSRLARPDRSIEPVNRSSTLAVSRLPVIEPSDTLTVSGMTNAFAERLDLTCTSPQDSEPRQTPSVSLIWLCATPVPSIAQHSAQWVSTFLPPGRVVPAGVTDEKFKCM